VNIFFSFSFSRHPSRFGLGGDKQEYVKHPKVSTKACARALSFLLLLNVTKMRKPKYKKKENYTNKYFH